MNLNWSAVEGALIVAGSRAGAIDTVWKLTPEPDRTPVRRKFVIALVDHVREFHAQTGKLAPEAPKEQP